MDRLAQPLPRGFFTSMAIAAMLATGITLAAPAREAAAQVEGGTLNVGIETDVRGFDAVKGGVLGQTGETVMVTVQEPLVDYDQDTGEFSPLLATEWTLSDDKKSWTIKLREGVKFHDGNELTAEDVAHHYNRILDPENNARSRTFISPIQKAEAVDKHTVKFTLQHPWQPFMLFMATTSMSGPIPSKANVEADKQNRHPVGTGPFIFESWQGGDRIVVKKNPDYWDKDRKIYLDEIVFRILPDNQTRYASLKSGEVDVIWTDRGATINKAKDDPEIVVHTTDGAGAAITLINTANEHLSDQRVRAALAHAWNQDALVKISWQNTRPSVKHPLGDQADCGDAKYREYNPDEAKKLLEDYGKPVKISMIHTTTPRGRELGELMQQMYKAVGVELELQPVDQTTLVKRVFTKQYDISGWRIADGAEIGPQLFALSHSKSSYNLTGYSTPEFDKMLLAMRTAPDREMRLKLQCDIAAVINDSAHMLYRGGGRYHAFTNKKVKGLPDPYRGVVDARSVWLEE